MATKLNLRLYCGVALCALLVPGVALSASFTIVNGQTVTTTQTLNSVGDVGTVLQGGTINVPAGNGISTSVSGITINNAGSVTGGNSIGIYGFGNTNFITNSGTVTGHFGIYAQGDNNTVINSGAVMGMGSSFGIYAQGNSNTVNNSGTITGTGNSFGIYAQGNANTVINSGTITGTGNSFGIYAQGDANIVSNSGTVTGGSGSSFAVYAQGNANIISNSGTVKGNANGIIAQGNANIINNSGTIIGSAASVVMSGSNNTLNLLAGSNVQGSLSLGAGNFLNIGPGLNTALAYTGTLNLNTFGAPYVASGGVVAVIDPTGFAAQNEMLTDLTRGISNTVDGRLASARTHGMPIGMTMNGTTISAAADAPAGPNTVMWAAGLGNYRNEKSGGADASFNSGLGGLNLGFDGEIADRTRAGGFIGAALSNFATVGGSQNINTNSYFGGVYAGFTGSRHFLNLSLTGGRSNQSSDRTIANNQVVGGFEHATANYGGFFISPSATLGTDIHRNGGILTPSVRARYAGMFLDGYTEQGSTVNLAVASRNVNVIDIRGQLAFAPTPITRDNGTFNTVLRVGADGVFTSGNKIDAVLLGQSLSFNVGNNATTLRGFVGLDMAYATHSGSRYFFAAEAGYDTSNAFTGEAKVGLEIPL